ncbi:hypothetical protein WA026_011066 [Henosepilachna vigintioctopunctata]|uniref:Uncharacterized protein n=1 Tax=Henosepilachna vigintioctopunctata TaxID=420089 RepID=A0AAW1U5M9_9CUCU
MKLIKQTSKYLKNTGKQEQEMFSNTKLFNDSNKDPKASTDHVKDEPKKMFYKSCYYMDDTRPESENEKNSGHPALQFSQQFPQSDLKSVPLKDRDVNKSLSVNFDEEIEFKEID